MTKHVRNHAAGELQPSADAKYSAARFMAPSRWLSAQGRSEASLGKQRPLVYLSKRNAPYEVVGVDVGEASSTHLGSAAHHARAASRLGRLTDVACEW